jgi:hypothetical protein
MGDIGDTLGRVALVIAFGYAVVTIAKAWRARRDGSKYLFQRWDGGALLAGTSVQANVMIGVGVAEVLVILALAGGVPARLGLFQATPQLSFKPPVGWIDLSKSAPPTNFDGVSPEVASLAKESRFFAFAVDRPHADPKNGFAVVSAMVIAKTIALSDAQMSELYRKIVSHSPDGSQVYEAADFPTIAGQKVGRLLVGIHANNVKTAQMTVYVVPGRGQYSTVAYTIPLDCVGAYQHAVDDSIEATVSSANRNFSPRP